MPPKRGIKFLSYQIFCNFVNIKTFTTDIVHQFEIESLIFVHCGSGSRISHVKFLTKKTQIDEDEVDPRCIFDGPQCSNPR